MDEKLDEIDLLKLQLINEKIGRANLLIENLTHDIEKIRLAGEAMVKDRNAIFDAIKTKYGVADGDKVDIQRGNIIRAPVNTNPEFTKPVDT
jgi:hypothetical protein